jgi:stage II sporulation protein D
VSGGGWRKVLPLAALAILARCASRPSGGVPERIATPTPAATASPTPMPTPTPPPLSLLPVSEPRLDIGIALDRAAAALPAGDWLLKAGDRVERRRGSLSFSSRSTSGGALFVVQAGSFSTREAAEIEGGRLFAALGVRATVSESAGRFAVRLGDAAERKAAEALLARVRRESVPDSFLVSSGLGAAAEATVLIEENGSARVEWPSPVEVAPAAGAAPIPVGDGTYRGHLLFRGTGRGTVHVVNRVNLEDYVKGVVPGEMGPRVYDELEALKAQAVAARSYALRRKGDFAGEGFDLCATPRCQVYGGAAAEQPLTNQAADETAGEVLLFGGLVADALFTSTCGGRTENAADVFPSYAAAVVPYLTSVACAGETPFVMQTRFPGAKGKASLLGARGLALLAALGQKADATGLKAARNAVRARLGLPPRTGAHPLWPASTYEEVVRSGGFGDSGLLTESLEAERAPSSWPARARAAYGLLLRFQLGNGAALPVDRALRVEEAAGLWATVLARLGDFEEAEGRLVALTPGEAVVKTPKGRQAYSLSGAFALLSGGPDAFGAVLRLELTPGDRVRVYARDGALAGLAAPAQPSAGLYDRDSGWMYWTRRITGAELAAKLRERDVSRTLTEVRAVTVLERGASGRARKVRVTTDQGPLLLAGLEIRFALSLPESLFTVVEGKGAIGEPVFTFHGRGWGHGVGLCQNGAFGMALAGHDYREILGHYYPGAAVGPAPSSVSAVSARP